MDKNKTFFLADVCPTPLIPALGEVEVRRSEYNETLPQKGGKKKPSFLTTLDTPLSPDFFVLTLSEVIPQGISSSSTDTLEALAILDLCK